MTAGDVVLRSIIFVIVLFIATKILGKKQISQLSLFEYISGITLGDIAGEVVLGIDKHIMHGILGILVFGGVAFLADKLALKNRKFRNLVEGKSTVFVEKGKILEQNLRKENYTLDDFMDLLRQKDVFNVSEVEYAVLEPKGELSVLLKKENRPLTPKDLKMKVPNEREPHTIIMDGEIMQDELTKIGKTTSWVDDELRKLNVTLDNVFFAQVDSYGALTVDIHNDAISVPSPQERPLLYATMKKAQADLELFSLQTQNQSAKEMYLKNANLLKQIIDDVKIYLEQ